MNDLFRQAGAYVDVYPHDMEPGSVSDNWECDLRGCPNTLLTPHIGTPSPPMLAPLMRHRWRRVLTRTALLFLALLQVAPPKRRRRQSA